MNAQDLHRLSIEQKARECIILHCPPDKTEDGYYDTSWVMGVVQSSVRLLRMNGRLLNHPQKHHLVKLL